MRYLTRNLKLLFVLFLFSPMLAAQGDAILLCDVDISDRDSLFKWQSVEKDVPLYLYPNGAEMLYQRLLDQYIRKLSFDDQRRSEIKQFIELQKTIISKQAPALLALKPNPFSGEWELLNGANQVFPIDCDDVNQDYLIDIYYLALSYKKINDASFEIFREAASATIQQRNLQYRNWFDNGLPMWPQETWFNGLLLGKSDAEKPARHQWVIFRPSVGLGVNSSDGLSNGNVDATLGIEIGGFVRYLNNDYSNYWGLSVLATLGEDAGVGYGLLLRYDDYVLGYTHRGEDAASGIGSDSEYFYIGYDLYKLVHDNKDRFSQYRQKIRQSISAYQ